MPKAHVNCEMATTWFTFFHLISNRIYPSTTTKICRFICIIERLRIYSEGVKNWNLHKYTWIIMLVKFPWVVISDSDDVELPQQKQTNQFNCRIICQESEIVFRFACLLSLFSYEKKCLFLELAFGVIKCSVTNGFYAACISAEFEIDFGKNADL